MYKQLYKKNYISAKQIKQGLNEWNHPTTSRWELETEKYCIATKEEDFFSKVKALKVAKEVSK